MSSDNQGDPVSDPDGDVITHFWELINAPAGAEPVLSSYTSPNTDVTGLTEEGTYTFTLSVIDETEVTTRDVTVAVVHQPGDLDYDFDVDMEDFGLFQACYSGPGMASGPDCEPADLDDDGDVDQEDFAVFQECIGGANQPPGC